MANPSGKTALISLRSYVRAGARECIPAGACVGERAGKPLAFQTNPAV